MHPKKRLDRCRPVPRYFFDLHNDMDVLDEEGKELPDPQSARAHALREVRQMIHASIDEQGHIDLRHRIEIRDEARAIVDVLHFEDAVTIRRGDQVLSTPSVAA